MSYIDGFVVPAPKKRIGEYKKLAEKCKKIWKEYGALDYIEAVADDVKWGKTTSFRRAVKQKPNETVVFAYVVWKSRAARNAANKKVMRDPRLAEMCDPKNAPFDMRRMIYGGFKTLVSF